MHEQHEDITRPDSPSFSHFPKHLPEDLVTYSLYVIEANEALTPHQMRARLKIIESAARDLGKSLLKDYIWQRDPFALTLLQNQHHWYLHGRTAFGDSIADEWVVVHLLRELTRRFDDAWVRVEDADGQFLLVEAAAELPRWLEPDVAENRVWLHGGGLRIVPQRISEAATKKGGTDAVNLETALQFLAQHPEKLIASPKIEQEAFYRLRDYPGAISDTFHAAQVVIPRRLAYVLHRAPKHISPAVETFYLRDPISLKTLNENSKFHFHPDDVVTTSVKFTRVGYAQLKGQEFTPPPLWTEVLRTREDAKQLAQAEMGMKLSCGFEMLVSDPQNRDKQAVREIQLLLGDIESGDETLPSDEDILSWPKTDQSESWLNVNFADFEKELAGRGSVKDQPVASKDLPSDEGFGDKAAQANLRRIVDRFEKFVDDDTAGPEGAEFGSDADASEVSDEMEDSDTESADQRWEGMNDDEQFVAMMKDMMRSLPEYSDGAPKKEADEDGSKPADLGEAPPDDEDFVKMMKAKMKKWPHEEDDVESFPASISRVQELESDSDDEEELEDGRMQTLMDQMEAELQESGALNLDPDTLDAAAKDGQALTSPEAENARELLAKNLLQSLEGHAGGAGPIRSIFQSLGVQLPEASRDEENG